MVQVGDRVRLLDGWVVITNVRIPPGEGGTVTRAGPGEVWVRLDTAYRGLDPWDNHLVLTAAMALEEGLTFDGLIGRLLKTLPWSRSASRVCPFCGDEGEPDGAVVRCRSCRASAPARNWRASPA